MPNPVVRLSKELKDIQASPEPDIKLEPYDRERHDMRALKQTTTALPPAAGGADLYSWIAAVSGPPDSPFEGGTYHVLLRVPRDYPMSPPAATFLTHVFHPNVNFATGEICLDILKHRWSPAWTLSSVCRAISSLLACPEADSPLNCDAGNLVRAGDMVGYRAMVRLYAIEDAGAPPFPEGQ